MERSASSRWLHRLSSLPLGAFPGGSNTGSPTARRGALCGSGGPSPPSTTADVDSGPDPTTDEDEHSTSLRREDVGELQLAALSFGMEEAEGKDSLLPFGQEAAASLTVYRCWGGRGVGGQHPTRHPKLTVCPPTLHCRVPSHRSPQGKKCRAQPDPRGGESSWEHGVLGDIHGGHEDCAGGQPAELAAEGWVRWGPHRAVGAVLLHTSSVSFQGSPVTGRRPKGEWDTSDTRLG